MNCLVGCRAFKPQRTEKGAIKIKLPISKTSHSNVSMHTMFFPTSTCSVFHQVSGKLWKDFHEHRYFLPNDLPSVLILSYFQTILYSLPCSLQSNTTWSRSLPHFQHYTDYLEMQPAAPTQALTLSLEPTTVLCLTRSCNGSLFRESTCVCIAT